MRLSNTLIYAMLMAAPSWAGTIIGDLGTGNIGEFVLCCGNGAAAGFTMKAGTDFILDLAKVTVIDVEGSTFGISLYGTSGGNPVGPALVNFSHPPGTGVEQTINLVPLGSPFTLKASTTYWLVLSAVSWGNTSGVPTGSFATDAGTRLDNLSPPQSVFGGHFLYEIDGTAVAAPGAPGGVPEPATIGIVGLSLLGLLWARRRTPVKAPAATP